MSWNNRILECVPNFSEGRDKATIQQIVDAIGQVSGVKVLHVDSGVDANRTVVTFVGAPEGIEEAAFQGIKTASELIDMRQQRGTHPRLGATDVMPIVPIAGVSIEEATALSYRLSERVSRELLVPVYNYEQSAKRRNRNRLELIRKGEYEGLSDKMKQAEWFPDYGSKFNAKSGASIIGARHFLLAYNVNLATRDITVAKRIATSIRESGSIIDGHRQAGLLQGVKAIGWDVPEYGMVQVSTNITNTEKIGLHDVYETVRRLALDSGVDIAGSELIGLIPKHCLLASGAYYSAGVSSDEEKISNAINNLGLESVVPFDPEQRIIEHLL